jgi:hypothetical protein
MVLKYIVRDAAWPALWMGVANVIANALVMLRYAVAMWREVEMRCELYADFLQFGHSMGEPEYGGRLHLQPGFVGIWRSRSCSYLLSCIFGGITCQFRCAAELRTFT